MAPPASIAHYRIVSKLGEGGMGAVYRATDTKLHREVAIKVLPDSFANDADRLARFTREAQVLAALNHPNIAAIYGVEERALVMELVEGETLQGPLPPATVLNYARQISEALDAAHEKGIVHRDLKPANIKVTPEGTVKVLDFGIAKTVETAAQSSANSPTLTIGSTEAGLIMGTAAYMSPEQARGQAVDKRADIWSLGVVLFELLTGKPLFAGETVSDVLAEVLRGEIDWSLLPANTPPGLRRLMERCLVRDRKKRLRDLGDAWVESPEAGPMPAPRKPIGWMVGTAVLAFLAAALGVLWQRSASRQEPPFVMRTTLVGSRTMVPINPEGSMVVWDSPEGLLLRRLSELRPRRLPGTEGAILPFWSGDSEAIGFFQQGKLRMQAVTSDELRTLADAPQPWGASWRGSAKSGEILYATAGKIWYLNIANGTTREIPLELPSGEVASHPMFLPEGADFVFTSGAAASESRALYRGSLKGGAPVRIIDTPFQVQYARHPHNGQWYMFYSTSGVPRLLAAPVDPATGTQTGEIVQLVDAVGTNSFTTRRIAVQVSENGRIVFRRNLTAAPIYRIRWHAADGSVLATLGDKLASNEILLSPDEQQVAAVAGFPLKGVFLFDARSGNSRRLSAPTVNVGQGVVWSRDSKMIYYQVAHANGSSNIVRHATDGSSEPETIGTSPVPLTLMDISPDGEHLLFGPSQNAGEVYLHLSTRPTAGQVSKPEVWMTFASRISIVRTQARFTPDGKFVFVPLENAGGRFVPWTPDRPAGVIQSGNVTMPLAGIFFSADGRRLCGADRLRDALVCHSVSPGPGGTPVLGPPALLFASGAPQSSGFGKIGTIAKDGRVLLLSTDEPEEVSMQFLSDWTALLPAANSKK